jgi:hypothetical protein
MSERLASFRAGASAATALLVLNREVPPQWLKERDRRVGGRPPRSPPGPDLHVLGQIDLGDSVTSGGVGHRPLRGLCCKSIDSQLHNRLFLLFPKRDSVPSPPLGTPAPHRIRCCGRGTTCRDRSSYRLHVDQLASRSTSREAASWRRQLSGPRSGRVRRR